MTVLSLFSASFLSFYFLDKSLYYLFIEGIRAFYVNDIVRLLINSITFAVD
jgi:hypothetical protein